MSNTHIDLMRSYMVLAEDTIPVVSVQPTPIEEPVSMEVAAAGPDWEVVRAELEEILFRMRAYQHDETNQTFSLGVEQGMMLASEWLENFITRKDNEQE